jgi:hypothetical protein
MCLPEENRKNRGIRTFKKVAFLLKASLTALLCFVSFCSTGDLAGNSSQTGNNGITVLSFSGLITGSSQPGVSISVYERNYLPHSISSGFKDTTSCDENGEFSFASLPAGFYNLLAWSPDGNKSAIIMGIPVFTDSSASFSDTLDYPGFLEGICTDRLGNNLVLSYVFIKGSPFYSVTRNNGEFLLGPLPANRYTLSFYANFVGSAGGDALSPVMRPIPDTSVAVVYPNSISHWNW